MSESTGPETAPEISRPGRVRWRRFLLCLLAAAGIVLAAEHAMGGQLSLTVLGVSAGAVLLVLVLWRLPHLRRHFASPYGRRETRTRASFRSPGSRSAFRSPGSGGRARRGGSAFRGGSGHSRGRSAFRSPGSGSRSRRGGASRPRGGSGILGRRNRGAASSSPGRRGSGSARRRAPGGGRRPGAGSRGSRPGSGTFRRFRPGSRGPATRRRGGTGGRRHVPGTRPGVRAGGRRRAPGTGGRRHVPGARPGVRAGGRRRTPGTGGRRSLRRPSTWFRPGNRPGTRPGGRRHAPGNRPGTRPGGRRHVPGTSTRTPRSWRRPATWFRRHQPGSRMARQRQPGRVRRAWYRVLGTPQQRRNRRAANRASRARNRARRSRTAPGAYARRTRWYAPWRAWAGGSGLRAAFRARRARLGRPTPHLVRRAWSQPLGLRARLARRWHIRRGTHRGLGIGRVSLRARLAGLRGSLTRAAWGRRAVRVRAFFRRRRLFRRPPRLLAHSGFPAGPGGSPGLQRFRRSPLGRLLTRLDRRRSDRWLSRYRRHHRPPPVPVPWPAPRTAPAGGNHRPSQMIPGLRGGRGMDTHAMADEIRSMGGAEFADPQDVHDTVAGMHELVQAMQDVMNGWGLSLAETGVHPAYPETVHEAAGMMAGISDKLEGVLSGGVMRGPGG